ncbi:dihydrolipoyllysine-residue succinyltransferase component of 2-oxoglutarate dehydrogenase complex 2, mitochondrial isoform X2 [Morus notabilis]|nr:dihydrolipoyllysine-residue succinyltransferase component of 2-oxoglutarate dehydrogenase complex 2, mitochondrial isoform X2 [Morus notabilis]
MIWKLKSVLIGSYGWVLFLTFLPYLVSTVRVYHAWNQHLLAKEGETVEPGVKIAVISKSGEGAPQVAPLEQPASQPSPPKKQESVEKQTPKAETAPVKEAKKEPSPPPKAKGLPSPPKPTEPQLPPKDRERRVPMTRLRKRVATRLKDSQNTFAMLTTFNEVDI